MTDLIVEILGEYVPLAGDGLAAINWPWIVSAVCWVLLVWFILKLIIRLVQGSNNRRY